MSFEGVVCWDHERVEQVMRIDADAARPAVVLGSAHRRTP